MKTVLNLILVAGPVIGLASAAPVASEHRDVWVERRTVVMGTVLEARVAAPDREAGLQALEAAFAEVRALDGVLSNWSKESELASVNGARPGERVRASYTLLGLLEEAFAWSRQTHGAFDPAIGALIDTWGFRSGGSEPNESALARARASSGIRHFVLHGSSEEVERLVADASLDSGGFGKGAALRAAAEVLQARGVQAAELNFGGQILVFGGSPEGGDLRILPVAHPSRREEPAAWLRVSAGSISTTGQSERYIEVAGNRYGHVLDPRSGLPVPAWGSVTVISADPLIADVLSTALFVMGPEEGLRWAEARADIGVLFLEEVGDEVVFSWNRALKEFLIKLSA